jgi:hypothetical protein
MDRERVRQERKHRELSSQIEREGRQSLSRHKNSDPISRHENSEITSAKLLIKVSLRTGPACGLPKRKLARKEKRKGRQSVVPVARLGTVVGLWLARRPGQFWL